MFVVVALISLLTIDVEEAFAMGPVTLLIKARSLQDETITYRKVIVDQTMLDSINATKEQIEKGWLEVNGTEQTMAFEDGRRITAMFTVKANLDPIEPVMRKKPKPLYLLNTIEGLADNPSLFPLPPIKLEWDKKNSTKSKIMTVTYSTSHVELHIDERKVVDRLLSDKEREIHGAYFSPDEGILLFSINLQTGNEIFTGVYSTNDYGVYRDLNFVLDSLQKGNLIVLASFHAASLNFDNLTRLKLSDFGSTWARNYLYRDSWMLVYINGGQVLLDVILPNFDTADQCGSPFQAQLILPQISEDEEEGMCPSWPKSDQWDARRIFCMELDGFIGLCDCNDPFQFNYTEAEQQMNPENTIPISILVSGNNVMQLFRLLEDLRSQKGLTKNNILLMLDGPIKDVEKLAFILGLPFLIHRKNWNIFHSKFPITRFALYHGLYWFSEAKYFIVLEDNLRLSVDFYSFMVNTSKLFDMDPTIWCVSAFNTIAYSHTSKDETSLHRNHPFPTYGWMMPRDVVKEILPIWPIYATNWNIILSSIARKRDRLCIVPEVLRSMTPFTTDELYFQDSTPLKNNFYERKLNDKPNVILQPLKRMTKETYEHSILELLREATPLEIKNIESFKPPISKNGTFVIFINKTSNNFVKSSFVLHNALGIWNFQMLTYSTVVKFPFFNATMIIILIPSNYSFAVPTNYHFFNASAEEVYEVLSKENKAIRNIRVRTHKNNFLLPLAEINWDKNNLVIDRYDILSERRRNYREASISSDNLELDKEQITNHENIPPELHQTDTEDFLKNLNALNIKNISNINDDKEKARRKASSSTTEIPLRNLKNVPRDKTLSENQKSLKTNDSNQIKTNETLKLN